MSDNSEIAAAIIGTTAGVVGALTTLLSALLVAWRRRKDQEHLVAAEASARVKAETQLKVLKLGIGAIAKAGQHFSAIQAQILAMLPELPMIDQVKVRDLRQLVQAAPLLLMLPPELDPLADAVEDAAKACNGLAQSAAEGHHVPEERFHDRYRAFASALKKWREATRRWKTKQWGEIGLKVINVPTIESTAKAHDVTVASQSGEQGAD